MSILKRRTRRLDLFEVVILIWVIGGVTMDIIDHVRGVKHHEEGCSFSCAPEKR